MGNSARLFSAPGVDGIYTVSAIAALAGCSTVNAYVRIRDGKPVGGHVWSVATDAPNGRARKLMESDDFPGRTFTQDEVRAMGKLKSNVPLQPYVRKQYKIAGHVWRFVGSPVTRSPGEDNVGPSPVLAEWRRDRQEAREAAPAPEARRWVYATDPEAYDVVAVNPMRLSACDGPEGGASIVSMTRDPADDRRADYGSVPARAGWWIRWDGRADWFPVSASFAAWVVPQMRDGDRLVLITPQTEAVA